MYLKELTNEEFRTFTEAFFLSSIYQTPEYAFVMNEQNQDSIFLGLLDDQGQIVAATLLLIRRESGFKYAYAPRGFLLDYQNLAYFETFTEQLKGYLSKKDIIAVRLSPLVPKSIYDSIEKKWTDSTVYEMIFEYFQKLGYHHLGFHSLFEGNKPRFEAILSLRSSISTLFSTIQKEFRTKIRSASTNGIVIYKGGIEQIPLLFEQTKRKYPYDLQYFKNIYRFFSKMDKVDFYYTKLNTSFYLKHIQEEYLKCEIESTQINQDFIDHIKDKKVNHLKKKLDIDKKMEQYKKKLIYAMKLLERYPDGIVTSTILTIRHQRTVSILMDGYDPTYHSFNSKHFLIWNLIEQYKQMGYYSFSLGGMTDLTLLDNPYKGLNDFKLGFSPLVYEYIGDFELITNAPLYFMYKKTVSIKKLVSKKS